MTEKGSPNASVSPKLKTLLFQGAIGAVSLMGATAIPLIVQQFLAPTPVSTPASTALVLAQVQAAEDVS